MLTLKDLKKSFGAVMAVDGVSLRIEPGEVFGLLGPNGAGKSTTIGMAVGLIRPDSGAVLLDGVGDPSQPLARRALGIAPQSLAIYDDLSARENLDFFGRLYGITGKDLKKRVGEVLEHVGLTSRAADRVGAYSGGMKRRLNLAVAIIHRPAMLLLDEPTAGVDPQSRNNILDLVRDLAAGGTTIVYTTHYMEEAAKLCARVAIIDHGKVLATGTVSSLVGQFGGKSVITVNRGEQSERFESADPVSVVAKVMSEPGHGVDGLRIDRPDLESVFLNLTGRSLRD